MTGVRLHPGRAARNAAGHSNPRDAAVGRPDEFDRLSFIRPICHHGAVRTIKRHGHFSRRSAVGRHHLHEQPAIVRTDDDGVARTQVASGIRRRIRLRRQWLDQRQRLDEAAMRNRLVWGERRAVVRLQRGALDILDQPPAVAGVRQDGDCEPQRSESDEGFDA